MMYNHFLPLLSFLYLLFIQLLPLLRFEPSTFHFALWLSMFAFGCLLPLLISTLLFFLLEPFTNCSQFCSLSTFSLLRLFLSDFEFTFEFVNSWSKLF